MINPIREYDVFLELFSTLPQYHINTGNLTDKVFFHTGDVDELSRVLITKQENGQKAYPLLWLKQGYEISEGERSLRSNFEFVLAMNTQLDYFIDQRFRNVFNNFLYPNLGLIIQAFNSANNIQLHKQSDGKFYKRINRANYGKFITGKDIEGDYWDALELKFDLTIDNNCMGKINYNTKNII